MRKSFLLMLMMVAVSITAAAQNYALIDMDYILEEIPAYRTATEQLNQTSQQWQTEVETAFQGIQQMFEQYQTNHESMTAAQRTAKEEEIMAKEREATQLRTRYFGPEGEFPRLQDSLLQPIQDRIYEAVKAIAEQRNYAMVIDRASATSVIFASPSIDISDEVLTRLGY